MKCVIQVNSVADTLATMGLGELVTMKVAAMALAT